MGKLILGLIVSLSLSLNSSATGITGPDNAPAGSIVVLTAHAETGSRYRWIFPEGMEAAAHTGRQVAIIPKVPGTIEVLLVEVTATEIQYARHAIKVSEAFDDNELADTADLGDPVAGSPAAAIGDHRTRSPPMVGQIFPGTRTEPNEPPAIVESKKPEPPPYAKPESAPAIVQSKKPATPPDPKPERAPAQGQPTILVTMFGTSRL